MFPLMALLTPTDCWCVLQRQQHGWGLQNNRYKIIYYKIDK